MGILGKTCCPITFENGSKKNASTRPAHHIERATGQKRKSLTPLRIVLHGGMEDETSNTHTGNTQVRQISQDRIFAVCVTFDAMPSIVD